MKIVAEIMNRRFYYASQAESIGSILHEMSERGLGSVPVLDLAGRPLGVATMALIQRCFDMEELTEHLVCPAVCAHQSTSTDVAARTLGLQRADTLILVDDRGVAVGSLTALQLLRATLGLDASPAEAGRAPDDLWSTGELLELSAVHRASEAPGVIVLCSGADREKAHISWAEAADNMRDRLDQMLRSPQSDPRLEALLDVYPRMLRFQCLTIHDERQRKQLSLSLAHFAGDEKADPDAGTSAPAPRSSVVASKSERVASRDWEGVRQS